MADRFPPPAMVATKVLVGAAGPLAGLAALFGGIAFAVTAAPPSFAKQFGECGVVCRAVQIADKMAFNTAFTSCAKPIF